jgi:hypothetical protein
LIFLISNVITDSCILCSASIMPEKMLHFELARFHT